MQYLTLALALSVLLTTALAAPSWQVRKWQFSRGQGAYDYRFTVSGREQKGSITKTPGFTATCSGQAGQQLAQCTVPTSTATAPAELYGVSARVKIVADPENPNDSIPRVFVREQWTTDGGLCNFTETGNHFERGVSQPVGSDKGSRFKITDLLQVGVCA